MQNLESLKYFIPELLIVFSILFVILLDLFNQKKHTLTFILIASFLIGLALYFQGYSNESNIFLGMLTIDSLSYYFKWIIIFATF